jgi:2-C-methyl-D-erythritol 4-phosphate cytidylyltransferase
MGGVRKPFLELAGRPTLLHALRPFLEEPRVVSVVVALSAEDAAAPPAWLTELDARVRIVQGGDTRTESVRRAIEALPGDVQVIAVHDAARPLVSADTVTRCVEVALGGVGAVAGCPAVDTMKQVDGDGRIVDTPDRATLWHAQTPQVFPAEILRRAYAVEGADGTDDAALVERVGGTVRMVDAGPWNIKVTHPEDVVVAGAVLMRRFETAP